ncbi:hypothetical protein GE061_010827 [Apolygus lucorum]|uniref:CCHC-type domain-containing protein n=1 Tax=Apolygus lucorum TaxID=248454 RepID=A0A6A4JVD9_APOLU|nr:hypothetical protein GE061_010827 [Apolygus lucorum]
MQSQCDMDVEKDLQRRIEETVEAALCKHGETAAQEIQQEASRLQRLREIQIRKVILQNFTSQTEYLRAEALEAVVAKHVEYMMEFHKFNDRLSRMHAEAIKQLDKLDMAMMTDAPLETVASLEVGEFDPNVVRQLTVGVAQTGLNLPHPNRAIQANGAFQTNGASHSNGLSQINGDKESSSLDLSATQTDKPLTPSLNIYEPQPEEYDDLNRKFTNLQFDPSKQTIVAFNDEFNSLLRKMEYFEAHHSFKGGADAELYIRNRYLAAISKVFPYLYEQQTSEYAAKERVGLEEIMRRAQIDFNHDYAKCVAEPSTSVGKTKDSAFLFKSRSKSSGLGNRCYVCGTTGHYKNNCPNLDVNPDNSRTCYNCRQVGHLSMKCPFKKTFKSKASREKEKKRMAGLSRDRSRSREHSSKRDKSRDQSCNSQESRSPADLRPMNGRSKHGRRCKGRLLTKRRSTSDRSQTPAPQKKRCDSTRGKPAMAWELCYDEDAISLSSPSLDDSLS